MSRSPTPRPVSQSRARAVDDEQQSPTTAWQMSPEGVPAATAREAVTTVRVPGLGTWPGAEDRTLQLVAEERAMPVVKATLTVGRATDNDLVLQDGSVSARHCRLRRAGRRLLVEDLGSTNGTYLGGVRVFVGEVRVGTRIGVGNSVLRLHGPATAAALPPGSAAAARYAIIGRAPAVQRLVEQIERVAPTRATVLVTGESGTGKELVARALHAASDRARQPFVVLNCAAITRELAESELFGHERGAFTGAVGRRVGVFEEASGGTLFLDEVGELAPSIQAKLLRVLETQRVRRVGGASETPVVVRVVAATHQQLHDEVTAGRFRLDLYHRLAQIALEVPPLRARTGDIPLLCNHFLDDVAPEVGRRRMAPAALKVLARAPWPGNVRELRNVIFRAALFGGPVITTHDLEAAGLHELPGGPEDPASVLIEGRTFAEIEREVYRRVLRRHQGSRRAAAAALGISKSTLCDRVRRYQLIARP